MSGVDEAMLIDFGRLIDGRYPSWRESGTGARPFPRHVRRTFTLLCTLRGGKTVHSNTLALVCLLRAPLEMLSETASRGMCLNKRTSADSACIRFDSAVDSSQTASYTRPGKARIPLLLYHHVHLLAHVLSRRGFGVAKKHLLLALSRRD